MAIVSTLCGSEFYFNFNFCFSPTVVLIDIFCIYGKDILNGELAGIKQGISIYIQICWNANKRTPKSIRNRNQQYKSTNRVEQRRKKRLVIVIS